MAIGTLLSWASFLFISVNGIQTTDGKLVLLGAVLAGACVAVTIRDSARGRWYLLGGLFGLGSFGISIFDLIRIFSSQAEFFDGHIGASPGIGLWFDVIGGGVLVGAVFRHWQNSR